MPPFRVTVRCRECDGFGQLARQASETLEIRRSCPNCYGEGQQVFYEPMYESIEEVRKDYPDAANIKEVKK